ncbi:MAG: hypothetical protein NTV49_03415 [Kiritimatiellaeota bacterium]|nr:hypothetical protein [Kiritimatiellota bacterium]
MKNIIKCIEVLRVQLERHRKEGLNSLDRLRDAEAFVRKSFSNATRK